MQSNKIGSELQLITIIAANIEEWEIVMIIDDGEHGSASL
jgi:hypothetical protein